jgi:hypothetical protein
MEFKVLGRDVTLRLTHVLLNLGALLVIAILAFLIGFLAAVVAARGFDMLLIQEYQLGFMMAISVASLPLLALVLFALSGVLKMKKDVTMCRSLASGFFVMSIAYNVFAFITGFFLGLTALSILGLLSLLASSVVGSILIYLWLLIFLKLDKERLKFIAPYALFFAIAMLAVGFLANASLTGTDLQNVGESFSLNSDLISGGVYHFLLAIPLLYFTLGRKIDHKAAYLFAAFFLGNGLLALLAVYDPLYLEWLVNLYILAKRAIALVLLYLLARYGASNV